MQGVVTKETAFEKPREISTKKLKTEQLLRMIFFGSFLYKKQ